MATKIKKYSDLMIDLETTGTSVRAGILSLGACLFDPLSLTIGPTFYAVLNIDDQVKKGRALEADTMKWWSNQSEEARQVFKSKKFEVNQVLEAFNQWLSINASSKVKPWGNGAHFDITLMETLYADYGIKVPWQFWNVRDLRTFKEYVAGNAAIDPHRTEGTYHNAKDDAVTQVKYVLHYLKEQRKVKK